MGYSLTEDISEQCLFMCYGTGANGKSMFLTILGLLGGKYAYNLPFVSFEAQTRPSIPNDLAALVGRRVVTSSETNEGMRLNEARMKSLTGGDPITARFLYGENFTFNPVAKIWLAVNHRPRVTDVSYGFWRRVRLVPFPHPFKKDADAHLLSALIAELPGVLAWAVQGAMEWQQRGLTPPASVTDATESYRVESDPVGQFIVDYCVMGDACEVGAAALYVAYKAWCATQGMGEREMLTATAFGRRIGERFKKRKGNRGAMYGGVGLRAGGQ